MTARSDAHPLKISCVGVVVCAPRFHSFPRCFQTRSEVLVLVLRCCVHEKTGGRPPWGTRKGSVPFPCLWPLALSRVGFWERAGECPPVNLCCWCVLKSLVLLWEGTSPPGAPELYVQNNKWQTNHHQPLSTFSFLEVRRHPRGVLGNPWSL